MKVEFKDIVPKPVFREVVITLSCEDAKSLHNALYRYAVLTSTTLESNSVNRLMNALTDARVQCT